MDILNTLLLAVSMALDTMCVGAIDGLNEPKMKWYKLLIIGFAFGLFQFLMPVIGYFIGYGFKDQLESSIPWIAFSLLLLLSLKSLFEFFKGLKESKKEKNESSEDNEDEKETKKKIGVLDIILQAIATSIDALCIGFIYIELSISNSLLVFGIIGVVTFFLSSCMIFLGKFLGSKIKILEKISNLLSAIVFFGVGLKILLESLLS